MSALNSKLRLRPIEKTDEILLCIIYSSTREDEMALLTDWPAEAKSAFLQQQFQAQHTFYMHQYPNADFLIILCDGIPAGRLYIDRGKHEIRIVDITLLPDFRSFGYGKYMLSNILKEASDSNKHVTIHVERNNRALHLYESLGFHVRDDSHAIYLLMEWNPTA